MKRGRVSDAMERFDEGLEKRIRDRPSLLNLARDWNIPRDIRTKIISHLGPIELAMVLMAHFRDSSRKIHISHDMLQHIVTYALFHGYISLFEWAEKQAPFLNMDFFMVAAVGGQVEMLDWLWRSERAQPFSPEHICVQGARAGHLSVLKFAQSLRSEEGDGFYPRDFIEKHIAPAAAKRGYIDILDWCLDEYGTTGNECVFNAIQRNQIEVIKWLMRRRKMDILPEHLSQAVFYGRIEIMDLLADAFPSMMMDPPREWTRQIITPNRAKMCTTLTWMRRRGISREDANMELGIYPLVVPKQILDSFPEEEKRTEYRQALDYYFGQDWREVTVPSSQYASYSRDDADSYVEQAEREDAEKDDYWIAERVPDAEKYAGTIIFNLILFQGKKFIIKLTDE